MPDTLPAINDETKEMIEGHVKKGKARKFFLICKGANISTLEVFKKGPYGPRIMKAKKDGFKGEVTYGVVTGAGKELYFQLAGNEAVAEAMKVDSFAEKPPTKRAKLRDFLNENGLNFKCNYYIITSLSDAPDPEGEAVAATPPTSALALDDAAGEGESAELETEESVEVTPPLAPPTPSDTNLFTERLKALKPSIDSAVAAGGPIGEELKLRLSETSMFARKQEFDQANKILDKIEELLKKTTSAPPVPPPLQQDPSGPFGKRLAEVIGKVKEAAGTPAGDQAKLKVSEAGVFARKKDFAQANALLDEAEKILNAHDDNQKDAKPPHGTISFAKSRLEWQTAKKNVEVQLDRLQATILGEFDDDEALECVKKLELVLSRFNEGLSDSLDELYNADSDKKQPMAQAALQTVKHYLAYVESDELIAHIEANPYESLTVRASLLGPLMEIQNQLQTVA
jgi:hypothetical protein